jgi:thymidylate synthase
MRIYSSAYELYSEAFRDMHEMSQIVKPKSMQNKDIEGDDDYITKEIQHYIYTLTGLDDPKNLFLFEDEAARLWCAEEFKERINTGQRNPGDAWKLRRKVWEPFLNLFGRFDYTYSGRLNYTENLALIIKELAANPDTRQTWLPIFWPEDVRKMRSDQRIPCSLGYHFMIREGQLNLTYIQRSADLAQHFGNDVMLAWLMMEYVTNQLLLLGVDIKIGYLTHHVFSLHTYKKDWNKLEVGISKLANYETK